MKRVEIQAIKEELRAAKQAGKLTPVRAPTGLPTWTDKEIDRHRQLGTFDTVFLNQSGFGFKMFAFKVSDEELKAKAHPLLALPRRSAYVEEFFEVRPVSQHF